MGVYAQLLQPSLPSRPEDEHRAGRHAGSAGNKAPPPVPEVPSRKGARHGGRWLGSQGESPGQCPPKRNPNRGRFSSPATTDRNTPAGVLVRQGSSGASSTGSGPPGNAAPPATGTPIKQLARAALISQNSPLISLHGKIIHGTSLQGSPMRKVVAVATAMGHAKHQPCTDDGIPATGRKSTPSPRHPPALCPATAAAGRDASRRRPEHPHAKGTRSRTRGTKMWPFNMRPSSGTTPRACRRPPRRPFTFWMRREGKGGKRRNGPQGAMKGRQSVPPEVELVGNPDGEEPRRPGGAQGARHPPPPCQVSRNGPGDWTHSRLCPLSACGAIGQAHAPLQEGIFARGGRCAQGSKENLPVNRTTPTPTPSTHHHNTAYRTPCEALVK